MTDTDPPRPAVKPARRSLMERFSVVWLVPLAALVISLAIVWQNYAERGPVIKIRFENAAGVKPDETELRYRDVTVGLVEGVAFTDGLQQVEVMVRVEKEVAPFIDDAAQFWVVRPEVTTEGVSGLETVLSGVYIAGSWDGEIGQRSEVFEGAPKAPLVRSDQQGLSIQLRSSSVEGLSEGTPILYRGITVGRVANLRLSDDGVSVVADGFIEAPVDRLITTATRFWDTSGFSFSFGAQGAQLDVNSLSSLVTGGVAFDTIVTGGEAVEPGRTFQLFADEESARSSLFSESESGPRMVVSAVFEDAVAGLEPGAAVEFRGITVGKVTGLTGIVDAERFGDRRVRLLTNLELQTTKMGLGPNATEAEALDFLSMLVDRGLRAQLQSASILGGLRISLVEYPEAEAAVFDLEADPFPILPSTPADLQDFTDTAEGVFRRINALPIEELLGSAINVLDSVNRVLNDDAVTETPRQVVGLLGDVRALVQSDGVQGLPDEAAQTMAALRQTAQDLQAITTQLREAEAVAQLTEALAAAEEAADAVTLAVNEVPATLEQIEGAVATLDGVLASVAALPIEDVVAQAEGVLGEIRTILGDPATQGLPADISATLAEAEGLIADIRGSGLLERAEAVLASAERSVTGIEAALQPVLDSAQAAAQSVSDATTDLPALVEDIRGLTGEAQTFLAGLNELPLDQVTARATGLLERAEALVGAPEFRALPGDVSAALSEAQGLIADLREAGLAEQATGTLRTTEDAVRQITAALTPVLAEARSAAQSINAASQDVPRITAEIEALVAEANGLPLAELAARAEAILAAAETLVAAPETQEVPGRLSAALDEAQGLLADLREAGLAQQATGTLRTAEDSVRQITAALTPVLAEARTAAQAISAASADVPRITARADAIAAEIEELVAGAGDLPLQELAARAEAVLVSAEALVAAPETQAVPGQLNAALAEVERLLAAVRDGGLIENANSALRSAGNAADAVSQASGQLPQVVRQINALLAQATSTLGGYQADGQLGSEARAALRDIRDAARAVESLSRTIERNPNSLLLGR